MTSSKRSPGRPGAATRSDRRQQILDAARELFSQQSFSAVSLRQVAQAAGVNAALIHYYFGDKQGLCMDLLGEALDPLLDTLMELASEPLSEKTLETLFVRHADTLARHPWIAPLIAREVLAVEGPFRDAFIARVAGRGGPMLMQLVQQAQQQGLLRADVTPPLATLSLLSLSMFPFIVQPIASKVLGLSFTPETAAILAQHNFRMFMQGAARREDQ